MLIIYWAQNSLAARLVQTSNRSTKAYPPPSRKTKAPANQQICQKAENYGGTLGVPRAPASTFCLTAYTAGKQTLHNFDCISASYASQQQQQ